MYNYAFKSYIFWFQKHNPILRENSDGLWLSNLIPLILFQLILMCCENRSSFFFWISFDFAWNVPILTMDAYNRFNRCLFEWERSLLRLLGHDFMGEKFERNIMTFVIYALLFTAFSAMFYTFAFYSGLEKIFSVLFFLIAIQVTRNFLTLPKFYNFNWHLSSLFYLQSSIKLYHIRYVDDLQWILRFVQKFYKIHVKTGSAERIQYFNTFAMATEYLFIVMTTLYLLSVFTFFPYPVYMYLFENEVVTIVPIYLPFIDHTQFVGYCIVGAFHITLFIFATLGILACDFFMAIVIISTLIFSKLISLDLQQTDIDCAQKSAEITVKGRFRNVLLMHQEMIK